MNALFQNGKRMSLVEMCSEQKCNSKRRCTWRLF